MYQMVAENGGLSVQDEGHLTTSDSYDQVVFEDGSGLIGKHF